MIIGFEGGNSGKTIMEHSRFVIQLSFVSRQGKVNVYSS